MTSKFDHRPVVEFDCPFKGSRWTFSIHLGISGLYTYVFIESILAVSNEGPPEVCSADLGMVISGTMSECEQVKWFIVFNVGVYRKELCDR